MIEIKNLKDLPPFLLKEMNGLNKTFPNYLEALKLEKRPEIEEKALNYLTIVNQVMEDISLDDKRLLEVLFYNEKLRRDILKQAKLAFKKGEILMKGFTQNLSVDKLKYKFSDFKIQNDVVATLMGIK